MNESTQLRRAIASDATALWSLRERSIRTGCRGHYAEELLERWLSAPMPDTFAERVSQELFVVAQRQSGVVGFAALKTSTAEIDAVFVSPEVGGQGVGARLLDHVESIAVSLGLNKVSLNSSLNAVSFYQRAGYLARAEGWHVTMAGVKIACVHMEKSLVGHAAV